MYFNVIQILEEELSSVNFLLTGLDEFDKEFHRLHPAMTKKDVRGLIKRTTSDGSVYSQRKTDKTGKRYYKVLGDDTDSEVIAIKQLRYNTTYRKVLEQNKDALNSCITLLKKSYEDYRIDAIEELAGPAYKDSTESINKNPAISTDSEWRDFVSRPTGYIKHPQIAIDGQVLKSKSELTIYNMLKGLGVDFHYEYPIKLRGENNSIVTVRADFVIRRPDGSYVIIEHLGQLSLLDYANDTVNKLLLYTRNNYVLGDNLFLTSESGDGCLNSKAIYDIVTKLILN